MSSKVQRLFVRILVKPDGVDDYAEAIYELRSENVSNLAEPLAKIAASMMSWVVENIEGGCFEQSARFEISFSEPVPTEFINDLKNGG